jgi:isopenicillin-N N-acyltransferase-like protein
MRLGDVWRKNDRTWFGRPSFALLCLLALLSACSSKPVAKVEEASLQVPVVVLAGSSTEMGTAHGQQLGEQIRPLHDQFLQKWIRNELQRTMAMAVANGFQRHLRPEHKDELAALSAAAGIESQQAMLANCFLDVGGMVACSTLTLPGSASADGVPRFARNLDFPSFNIADKASVLFVVKPADGRHGFVHIGWPGLIGVLSGMNEHGLALANMEVTRNARPPTAMPYTLLYRTLLERCRTVDEAIALLQATPKQTANNLMLMDAAGRRAVVEIYPERIVVREPAGAEVLISTNHRRQGDQPDFVPERCGRYERLHRETAAQAGALTVPALQKLLADVSQGDMTLQSMIFEPGNRVMYLATGKFAPTREWDRIDVKSLLAER